MVINNEPIPYIATFRLDGETKRVEVMATNAFDARKVLLKLHPTATKISSSRKSR